MPEQLSNVHSSLTLEQASRIVDEAIKTKRFEAVLWNTLAGPALLRTKMPVNSPAAFALNPWIPLLQIQYTHENRAGCQNLD